MFQSISWSQYFLVLLVATLLYYVLVWIIFFNAKIPALSGLANFRSPPLHGEDEPDEMLSTVQHIMDELRPVFTSTNKNELLYSLQQHLQKYRDWEVNGFRELLNEFIAKESNHKCSIRLDVDDLREVWTG